MKQIPEQIVMMGHIISFGVAYILAILIVSLFGGVIAVAISLLAHGDWPHSPYF